MKKSIISIISIVSILISSFSVSAAEVPRESAPCNLTNEVTVIIESLCFVRSAERLGIR